MRLIDTHCHLDYDYEGKSAAQIVAEAKANGVYPLMTIGVEPSSAARLQKLCDEIDGVFHSVGVHPHEASQMTDEDLDLLKKATLHPKCLAIGEIGLDYYYDHSPRDLQIDRFRKQLKLATEVNLPVIIHSRDGEADLIKELENYIRIRADLKQEGLCAPGVIHCFTGTDSFAKKAVEMGFMISFSGILTFKKAESIQATAKWIPDDRILVETDSPYLAPVPHRGKKCEPKFVIHTAQKLAEIRGVSVEILAQQTTRNAETLFGFSAAGN